jgi:hypothetical protein
MMDMIFLVFSSSKKIGLSSSRLGPYTLVTQKIAPLLSDSNLDEMEKGVAKVDRSLRLEEFQAVRIPREALVTSIVLKF